jgi:thiamine-phosphate pyrophosphorylase
MVPFDLSLYLVTDRSLALGRSLEYVVEEAVKGGVTMVQLREKDASSKEFYELAVALKKRLMSYRIPLIINDRLDILLATDADGLHIGQNDIPYTVARRMLGEDKIIGLSVENTSDAMEARELKPDYIGISPVFGTPTKTDTAPAVGLDGVREITRLCGIPSVGIGGINEENTAAILRAGADGVAVVSAIMSAPDPQSAAFRLKQIIDQSKV